MQGREVFERHAARQGGAEGLEEPRLPDFARESEARIVIGKDVGAVGAGHLVERLAAALGQDYRRGALNAAALPLPRFPPGAQQVAVGRQQRVKGNDHQYPNRRSARLSWLQFF